jgi:L-Ala-D/L-Glu epimerase
VDVTARIVTLRLRETFRIAREAQDETDVVQVEVRHGDVAGHGEAAPIERYGESAESALTFLEEAADALGDDPFALADVEARLEERRGERAAKAALDAALHDLCGKLVGLPVWRLLGLRRAGPPTSWTVVLDDPGEMARKAERDGASGRFRRLKLKLGGRDGLDVERVRAVRAATELPLQVDVNEAWTLAEALDALPALADLGVEYCEQPLRAGDRGGEELRRRSPVPIFVDEDCHTAADVAACARVAHGVNVKLAKSGGIREAVRIVHAARALGLGTMLGCMVESGLGIAAGAQVASLFDHVDLDGNLLLAEDPWPGVELADGVQLPAEAPGLGVVPADAERG